jgi:hypothetical protein
MFYAAMHNSPSPELAQNVYMTSGVVILIVADVGVLVESNHEKGTLQTQEF